MASGAEVICFDRFALKVGDGTVGHRTHIQGLWLQRYACVGLPKIEHVFRNGYVMERLEAARDPMTPKAMIEGLRRFVWTRNLVPLVQPNWITHVKFVRGLCAQWLPGYEAFVQESLAQVVRLENLTACLTHGDPTFENVMYRARGGPHVLIDPIPARPVVPDLLAVDLGKIMQSCLGYEQILAGSDEPSIASMDWLDGYSVADQRAARHFCLVHLLRMMPYLPGAKMRHRMEVCLGRPLLGLRP